MADLMDGCIDLTCMHVHVCDYSEFLIGFLLLSLHYFKQSYSFVGVSYSISSSYSISVSCSASIFNHLSC